jgi:hypothetical protein
MAVWQPILFSRTTICPFPGPMTFLSIYRLVSLQIKSLMCFKFVSFFFFLSQVSIVQLPVCHLTSHVPWSLETQFLKSFLLWRSLEQIWILNLKIRLTHRQDTKPPQGKTRLMTSSAFCLLTDTLSTPVDSNVCLSQAGHTFPLSVDIA